MDLIINKSAFPTDSTKAKVHKVYLCDSQKCKKISLGKSLIKVRGQRVCPKCGSGVTDVTYSPIGQSYIQRAGL